MNNQSIKSIFAEAAKEYKEHWESNLTYSLVLFCAFAISIMLLLALKIGFALPFFLLVLPLLYGMEIAIFFNNNQRKNLPLRGYFLFSLSYYQRGFRGSFKAWRNFFIMLGSYLAYLIVFSLIYCLVIAKSLPGFDAAISSLGNILSDENYSFGDITSYIAEDEALYPLFLYGLGGAYFVALIAFCFLYKSMMMGSRLRYLFPMLSTDQGNTFINLILQHYKKEYRKDYYGSTFPLFVFLIGGYLLGFLFAANFSHRYDVVIAIALSLSSFLFSFYLPFALDCFYVYSSNNEPHYWKVIVDEMKKAFEEAIQSGEAKESDRVKFEQGLKFVGAEIKKYHKMIQIHESEEE